VTHVDFSEMEEGIARRVALLLGQGLPDEVLTVKQAAKLLQLSESTVRLYATSGQLPGRKFGDSWRFRRSALLESISSTTP